MPNDTQLWRVEAACRAAWPALEEIEGHDRNRGWRLRFAAGHSHRANSANPLLAAPAAADEVLPWIEAAYAARGLPATLRLPGLIDDSVRTAFEQNLARRGYAPEGDSLTLLADLPQLPVRMDPDVAITATPGPAWLTTQAEWRGWDAATLGRYGAIVNRVAAPAGFMALSLQGEIMAMAFARIEDGMLCLNSMMANPARRGAGHGKRLLGALLAWGIRQGATAACLQVETENHPARALYRAMGFIREPYGYRYWVK